MGATVLIGNADAIDLTQHVNPDTLEIEFVFSPVTGERVTTFRLRDDLPRMDAVLEVIKGLERMMNPLSRPWWIECDDEGLRTMLCEHFGIALSTVRPPNWGDGSTTASTT